MEAEGLQIELSDTRGAETEELVAGVRRYNEEMAGAGEARALVVTVRGDDGRLLAGVSGRTIYRHFLIEVLWVDPAHRHAGLGTRVMALAEAQALTRGCVAAQVDTLSFQAPDFYRRLGFRQIGLIEDFPAGHQRHFLFKPYPA
jgi:ribosomal protein S18 acetylase RimI-like enzyme